MVAVYRADTGQEVACVAPSGGEYNHTVVSLETSVDYLVEWGVVSPTSYGFTYFDLGISPAS